MKHEQFRAMGRRVYQYRYIHAFAGLLILIVMVFSPAVLVALAATSDWPTYLSDNNHSGYNGAETIINKTSAPNLKLKWMHTGAGGISTQPVEANGLVYWGSWDGNEHATDMNNHRVWATFLGQTTDNNCVPVTVGVASSATIATVTINGVSTSVDFVGGGNGVFYALNAMTGSIIWSTVLGSSPSHFIWSSPTFFNGSIYVGMASFGDCPLVQGQVIMLNATNGAIEHTFNTVPNGCTGAGVWGAPTINPTTGLLYAVTGNAGSCSASEPYAEAIIKLNAADLSFSTSWQVPASQQGFDTDFGNTPTFFNATLNGVVTPMVGVANKNGIYYAFKQNLIHVGPVWQATVANSGDCPQCGSGSISPSAYDGQMLYVAGGNTTIRGQFCQGGLRALNPNNGSFIWEHCMMAGPVLGAVSVVPGVVALTEGNYLLMVDATTATTLYRFLDAQSGGTFYGGASVSNGVLYVGGMDGHLYAFAP